MLMYSAAEMVATNFLNTHAPTAGAHTGLNRNLLKILSLTFRTAHHVISHFISVFYLIYDLNPDIYSAKIR